MRTLTLAVVAMAAAACSGGSSGSSSSTSAGSSTGAPPVCVAGQTVACDVPGKCSGMQTCLPDGTEGPCVCPTTTGTTSGGTTGASITGTSGGQTSGGGTGSTGGGTGASGGVTSSGTTGGSFIGQRCTMQSACPDSQYCLSPSGTNGFCTISCGEGDLEAPDGGEQLCAETPALGGTPACGNLYTTNSDGGLTFYCALLCGNLGGVDEGTCPPLLTCTENICQ